MAQVSPRAQPPVLRVSPPGVPSRCPLPVAGAGAGGLVALSAAVRAISIPEPRLHPLNKKQTRN